jgi:hypothetical protein
MAPAKVDASKAAKIKDLVPIIFLFVNFSNPMQAEDLQA